MVLFRAVIFASGGFMIIVMFGMVLFAFRVAGHAAVAFIAALAILGLCVSGVVLQRFFLYRCRAAMLILFSGRVSPAPGLAAAMVDARRYFCNYSQWRTLTQGLRRVLRSSKEISETGPLPGICQGCVDKLAAGPLSEAVLVLAFSLGGLDIGRSAREGAALYLRHGQKSRRLAAQWLWFSMVGMALLFIFLAVPNWFFFKSAGAPVAIGIVLAAAIAWLLHQAFIVPFILAGLSGSLLAETRGQAPDRDLFLKLSSLDPGVKCPGTMAD